MRKIALAAGCLLLVAGLAGCGSGTAIHLVAPVEQTAQPYPGHGIVPLGPAPELLLQPLALTEIQKVGQANLETQNLCEAWMTTLSAGGEPVESNPAQVYGYAFAWQAALAQIDPNLKYKMQYSAGPGFGSTTEKLHPPKSIQTAFKTVREYSYAYQQIIESIYSFYLQRYLSTSQMQQRLDWAFEWLAAGPASADEQTVTSWWQQNCQAYSTPAP